MRYTIGVDVGGTFTDFLLMDEPGNFDVYKTPTTPHDPAVGFFNGLGEMADASGLSTAAFLREVELIVHGTTVTTNAVLTRTGARTALLTTAGSRDVLEHRRGWREELYDNKLPMPTPLVPRYLRFGIEERTTLLGEIVTPVDAGAVAAAVAQCRAEGVEAIAICFKHAYANGRNEEAAAAVVRTELPAAYLTVSSRLLPQIRLYERVSTTVFNAYVGPKLQRYLKSLMQKLQDAGFAGTLLIMQSNGGVTSPEVAMAQAASTLLSGPAAGPVAAIAYAAPQGYRDCITGDMGGTSFDVCLIRNQTPVTTNEGIVDRFPLGLPMVDVHTIGAGGGSIGWIDKGGLLRMGPQSAAADPGPACYGRGGEFPTSSDADLVLGYLNEDYFLGGRMPLSRARAEAAIGKHIAEPMGLSLLEAAAGMYRVVNVNMATAIREVTVKKGWDPRAFPLITAGGAGPVHAGMIAMELDIPVVIVPKESSVFCAAGMLLSDLKHDFVRTYPVPVATADLDRIRALLGEMHADGVRLLTAEGIAPGAMRFEYSADLRYREQYHEIKVAVGPGELDRDGLAAVVERFHASHEQLYGYHLAAEGTAVELLTLRVVAVGSARKPFFKQEGYAGPDASGGRKGERPVYLPTARRMQTVPVYDGMKLAWGNRIVGPAIVEQTNTSVFVPPEYNLICDRLGSYTMYRKAKELEVQQRIVPASSLRA
jgi:N-methylhydantoinase A